MPPEPISLDDKYRFDRDRVYLTGTQAIVRLPMVQRRRDLAAGLKTAGFISGYRGSPLGGYDQALWQAKPFLDQHHIHFQPGINEELAADALWGSQQLALSPGAAYDGVFGIWYGKGPGVDRAGDALKHANGAGTARHGGVLALVGDDHACKSSTFAHQSEQALIAAMVPILYPASVQELLDFGLMGWALSRYSGCWIALKTVAEILDSAATVAANGNPAVPVWPTAHTLPPNGLNLRWPDPPLVLEERLIRHKLPAVTAFVRANRLDRVALAAAHPRIGILCAGKSYQDVRQALACLGLSSDQAAHHGITILKVALTWPLDPEGLRQFALGLDTLLVVEDKRDVLEGQAKAILYHEPADRRPRIAGKDDGIGRPLLPATAELSAEQVAVAIARCLLACGDDPTLAARLAALAAQMAPAEPGPSPAIPIRRPHFCSGCPHNTSTTVPEGSRALAGIGCHYMATWMDRRTETFTQMGGEGAPWIGLAPFTREPHVFVNIGDGTYVHSGALAIRACVAAGVTLTFKILFNDAVAMTGGQPPEGGLTVPRLTHQLTAEGVAPVVVVTAEPQKYRQRSGLATGVEVWHRNQLETVQRRLRHTRGVSALVYDQTCAAEKRRRRKRGLMPDPATRVVIHPLVCEGCGDCSRQSNCLSVVPLETPFGTKRQIDQSSCNKDFSCLDGFCPSFITVHGGHLRRPAARPAGGDTTETNVAMPEPTLPSLDRPYAIAVAGVGGTGVVTVGALLGMAAHIDGRAATVLDMTGMAQKFGAVTCHIQIAMAPDDLHAVRIASGMADLLLGCDPLVASQPETLTRLAADRSQVILNSHEAVTGEFARDPDRRVAMATLLAAHRRALGPNHADRLRVLDATALATTLIGDAVAANLFLTGYAWQLGLIPISKQSILQAIALNGAAVEMNRQAFHWGRRTAIDAAGVQPLTGTATGVDAVPTFAEQVADRADFLIGYQDRAYADRYCRLVETVRRAETERCPGRTALADAVMRNYFKLLAYKDEYEVARLHTDPNHLQKLRDQFEGDTKLMFHLAPPVLSWMVRPKPGAAPRKWRFGSWILAPLRLLASLKHLRGTWIDPFGRTADRRLERTLIRAYEAVVTELLAGLSDSNHSLAVELASLPDRIRGYGHVKRAAADAVKTEETRLLASFRAASAAGAPDGPLRDAA